MGKYLQWVFIACFFAQVQLNESRKHHFHFQGKQRTPVLISSFELLKYGTISVALSALLEPNATLTSSNLCGFTIARITPTGGLTPSGETVQCSLDSAGNDVIGSSCARLSLDLPNKCLEIHRGNALKGIEMLETDLAAIFNDTISFRPKRASRRRSEPQESPNEDEEANSEWLQEIRHDSTDDSISQRLSDNQENFLVTTGSSVAPSLPNESSNIRCQDTDIPLKVTVGAEATKVRLSFTIRLPSEDTEGFYRIYLDSCYSDAIREINVHVVELNPPNNYLSAGEIPLPLLHLAFAVAFVFVGLIWMLLLCRRTDVVVLKFHYLMGAILFLRSLILMLDALNFRFIQTEGTPAEYFLPNHVTRLLKGTLVFLTALLAIEGYCSIRSLLRMRDKLVLVFVATLQLAASVHQLVANREVPTTAVTDESRMAAIQVVTLMALTLNVWWSSSYMKDPRNNESDIRKLKLYSNVCSTILCYSSFNLLASWVVMNIVMLKSVWIKEALSQVTNLALCLILGYLLRPVPTSSYWKLESAYLDDGSLMGKLYTGKGISWESNNKLLNPHMTSRELFKILESDAESDSEDEVVLLDRTSHKTTTKGRYHL